MKGINEIKQEKYISDLIKKGNYIGTQITHAQNVSKEDLLKIIQNLSTTGIPLDRVIYMLGFKQETNQNVLPFTHKESLKH